VQIIAFVLVLVANLQNIAFFCCKFAKFCNFVCVNLQIIAFLKQFDFIIVQTLEI